MTSILVIAERNSCNQLKCNYLKNKNFLWKFYSVLNIYIEFWAFWKKNLPHSLNISDIIDSEKRGYLNA